VARVEQLLSRFDRTSEVARVNREGAHRPVLVDRELFAILTDCRHQFERTDGYFDVRLGGCPRPFAETVLLEEAARTVGFVDSSIALDFGGYGKGYALDQAARVLEEFGVASALLHGGTSSVLSRGAAEDGRPWGVGVRDPFAEAAEREVAQLALSDCGLSSSAAFDHGASESDILDPTRRRRLSEPAACSVIAPTAVDAEVLSTALLTMGQARATAFVRERLSAGYRVAWIEPARDGVELHWLGEG
jgi:thiamine biosynthesis lipoprotein